MTFDELFREFTLTGELVFEVEWSINGRRHRAEFATKEEAEAFVLELHDKGAEHITCWRSMLEPVL